MATKYVCVKKCKHGKVWRPGETATEAMLKRVSDVIPTHFKPVGSGEAVEAIKEADPTIDGFKTNAERITFLKAKGLSPGTRATTAELQKMIEDVRSVKPKEDPLS